jgi:Zn-dependent protease/CBS domain-containing protein
VSHTHVPWSWKLGEVSGIAISIHATFLLLVVWFTLVYWLEVRNVPQVLSGIALLLALFACVLLHELGHALTAQRFGLKTRQITLLPIGGIATLERLPEDPLQGLWITLAGPAVNIAIVFALLAILLTTGTWMPLERISLTNGPFLQRLMLVNISLLVFNMLPAFPMDGGRALRSVLAMRMPDVRATRIAAKIGQGMAVLFAFVGLMANPILILIAIFVWTGAAQEATMAEIRAALRGLSVNRVMIREFKTLGADDRLSAAVPLVLQSGQHDFPVTTDGNVVGVLTRRDLLRGLAEHGTTSRVDEIMDRNVQIVAPDDTMDGVFSRLEMGHQPVALVVDSGQVTGMLTLEVIGQFLALQRAVSKKEKIL